MSTGIVTMADPPRMAMRIAMTTKVYGRPRASRTIHIGCSHRVRGDQENGSESEFLFFDFRYEQYTKRVQTARLDGVAGPGRIALCGSGSAWQSWSAQAEAR